MTACPPGRARAAGFLAYNRRVKDFRDQAIQNALDKAIGKYRPEKTARARLKRIAVIAALTLATVAGFWTALYISTPKPPPQGAKDKPVSVELLPPQPKR